MSKLQCWTKNEPIEKGYYAITSVTQPNYDSPCVAYWTGAHWECSIIFKKEDVIHRASPRTNEDIELLAILFRISSSMSYSMNQDLHIEEIV